MIPKTSCSGGAQSLLGVWSRGLVYGGAASSGEGGLVTVEVKVTVVVKMVVIDGSGW